MKKRLEEIKSKKPASFMKESIDIAEPGNENATKSQDSRVKPSDKSPDAEPTPAKPIDKPQKEKEESKLTTEKGIDESTVSAVETAPQGLKKLRQKAKKQRIEDTHTRKTYLVRNDLLTRLESVSENTHGFKIEFINYAIESALNELESTEFDENE